MSFCELNKGSNPMLFVLTFVTQLFVSVFLQNLLVRRLTFLSVNQLLRFNNCLQTLVKKYHKQIQLQTVVVKIQQKSEPPCLSPFTLSAYVTYAFSIFHFWMTNLRLLRIVVEVGCQLVAWMSFVPKLYQ